MYIINIRALLIASTVYHTVKHTLPHMSDVAIRTRDFSKLSTECKLIAVAACRKYNKVRFSVARSSATRRVLPSHATAGTVPRQPTRFVQGGDHFLTTAFTS